MLSYRYPQDLVPILILKTLFFFDLLNLNDFAITDVALNPVFVFKWDCFPLSFWIYEFTISVMDMVEWF